jgi:bacillithiol biosynthesis deacetylase BshB1
MTSPRDPCDVLVIAPHPDDAELACAGTLLKLTDAGRSVVVADLTAGEKGTRGTPETRASESAAAAKLLRLRERRCLGLPDTALRDDEHATRAVVAVLRELRPRVLLAPHAQDVNPDHVAAAAIVRRAYFHAGLRNASPDLGPPHRPGWLLWYPGNDPVEPSFCVDISALAARKRAVIACYATQVQQGDHFAYRLDPLARAEARDRYCGAWLGVAAAEPFWTDRPLLLSDLAQIAGLG